jgi:hypothetical protein
MPMENFENPCSTQFVLFVRKHCFYSRQYACFWPGCYFGAPPQAYDLCWSKYII